MRINPVNLPTLKLTVLGYMLNAYVALASGILRLADVVHLPYIFSPFYCCTKYAGLLDYVILNV